MSRLTIEQEEMALRAAAQRVGFEEHIYHMERKGDAHTNAEKIMVNEYRKGMPYKASYLYCDTLDSCFYFDYDGSACVTISARWRHGCKDLSKTAKEALVYIQRMLDAMTAEAERWLRGRSDERH